MISTAPVTGSVYHSIRSGGGSTIASTSVGPAMGSRGDGVSMATGAAQQASSKSTANKSQEEEGEVLRLLKGLTVDVRGLGADVKALRSELKRHRTEVRSAEAL